MNTISAKSFNEWLSESKIEADLRRHVQRLHSKSNAWRYGIESGDLYHDVIVKLKRHSHLIPSQGKLFSLVGTTAVNHLIDLSEKHSFRSAFFSKPMPTRLRPLPGSSMETVASKLPSPAIQAALSDEVARIRLVAASDPKLKSLFQALEELTGQGESVSTAKISQHLDLPCKQVSQSIQKLRAAARRNI
jgi:DNA-directed RNA polymerase specialized sigma24 family protein